MLNNIFNKKHFSKFQCIEKGITLIEVIVATFILLLAIVGSYLVFTQIFLATSSVSDRLVAVYLAQEGIEVIRNIRDTNWISGATWDTGLFSCWGGCQVDYKTGALGDIQIGFTPYNGALLNINSYGFYTYETGTPTKFKRKIIITPNSASPSDVDNNRLDILVEVIWSDRGQSFSFRAEESLYNWR